MSEKIYKPYSVVEKEWSGICARLKDAQEKLYDTQNPTFIKYPSKEAWNKYIKASNSYEEVKKELDDYKNSVQPEE